MIIQEQFDAFLKHLGITIKVEDAIYLPQEAFAEVRRDGFGASDSSRLLGVNPFPNGRLEDVINEKMTGLFDDSIGLKANVRMGRDLESFIIDKTNTNIIEEHRFQKIFKPRHMYTNGHGLNTNFDGIDLEYGYYIPVEVKTISKYGKKYYQLNKARPVYSAVYQMDMPVWVDTDIAPISQKYEGDTVSEHILHRADQFGIPPYYYTQLQQQILFTNAPYGKLLVLDVDSWEICFFLIPRDNVTIAELEKTAEIAYAKVRVALEPVVESDEDF